MNDAERAAAVRDVEDIYPLTPLQEGMLFHSLASRDDGLYIVQIRYLLTPGAIPQRLAAAWQVVVDETPVLRTSFVWESGPQPLQVVRTATVPVAWLDWSGCAPDEERRLRADLFASDRAEGFNLKSAPLLRLTFVQLGHEAVELLITFHHIVLDGWSLNSVLQRVRTVYEGVGGLGVPRPFREFVGWLRRQDLGLAERFWRGVLGGFVTATPVPLVGAPVVGAAPGEVGVVLSEGLSGGLRGLARSAGVTLNTVVQGAWAVVLARLGGVGEVVFGVTVAGRPPELVGVEEMVGLFINTVPLRVSVPAGDPVGGWLRGVQAAQAAVGPFGWSPLARVQGWSDLPRGEALFSSILVFENYPVDRRLAAPSRLMSFAGAESVERTNYLLTATVVPGERVGLQLAFNGGGVDGVMASRLVEVWESVLAGMAADPGRRVGELALVGAGERARLLRWGSGPSGVWVGPGTVPGLFRVAAAGDPGAVAVVCGVERVSYGELAGRVGRLAGRLRAGGVGPEVRVGVCLDRSVELVVALLAVLEAGGVYVPLDPGYPPARLAFMVADADARLILTRSEFAERLDLPADRVMTIDDPDPERDSEREGVDVDWLGSDPPGLSPDNLAYVIYTSGSTGTPKGVMITHRNAVTLVRWAATAFRREDQAAVVASTSVCFDVSVFEIFVPLTVAGTVLLIDDVFGLPALPVDQQSTLVSTVPSVIAELVRSGHGPRSRVVCLAGEPLAGALADDLYAMGSEEVYNLYGPTETTTYSTVALIEPGTRGQAPIGRPITATQVYLVDREFALAPQGSVSELAIGGAGVTRGYLRRPGLTADRFVPDPFAAMPGGRLYRTGDYARYLDGGTIEFLGRVDHQIKLRGHRIELGEIEATLNRHPEVSECAVVASAASGNSDDIQYLSAFVLVEPSSGVAPDELRSYLRDKLPTFMVPSRLMVVEELPKMPNGKIDRLALQHWTPTRQEMTEPPQKLWEQAIALVWQDVLGLTQVGVADNFFDVGGHSLLALRLQTQLRARLDLSITLLDIFDHPTVALMASLAQGAAPSRSVEPAFDRGKARRHSRRVKGR